MKRLGGIVIKYIKLDYDQHIAVVTINRPEALNALNSDVLNELGDAISSINTDIVRCLIITGSGEKSFVAGADIAQMSKMSKKEGFDFGRLGSDIFYKIETLKIPVIAAVNGYALGGGCELALCCDIRICSENAVFAQPEVTLGITPGYGGSVRLPKLIAPGLAKELLFTGARINALDAHRAGLVNAVYPSAELMAEAKKLAQKIAKNAPFAVAKTKESINLSFDLPVKEALAFESEAFGECFETDDQRNMMDAFVNKKK